MTNRVFVPTRDSADWQRLLASPEKHWRPGFSAMSAALSWEAARGLPAEVDQVFEMAGLGPTELLLAIPEWKTRLPGGERDSQTDVFALVRTARGMFATAVEAKVAESFGPTVGEWAAELTPGKRQRLTALCELLGVPFPPAPMLRYQLFHRTASAVIEARRFGASGAAMIVQSFSPDRAWLADWQAFGDMLGASLAPNQPAVITLSDGFPLLLGWACCAPNC